MIRYFTKSLLEKNVFRYDLPIDDDQGRGSLNAIVRQKRKKKKTEEQLDFKLFNRQNHLFFCGECLE